MRASDGGGQNLPLQTARIEALRRAEQTLSELEKLGLDYSLVENSARSDVGAAERGLQRVRLGEDSTGKASFDQSLFGS